MLSGGGGKELEEPGELEGCVVEIYAPSHDMISEAMALHAVSSSISTSSTSAMES